MKIIVAGCGKIGTAIIANLVAEGHDVIAIDNDPTVISDLSNIYDIMSVCGNGADHDVLLEAGAEKAELFVAVTNSDELNMLSCFIAREMGAKHTVARIRNPEYNDASLVFLKQHLHLSHAINPELRTAQELFNILKLPSAIKTETFSGGNFEIIELLLKPSSPLDGLRLNELRRKYPAQFLVCAVRRGDEVVIPDGSFMLKSGDHIGLTAAPTEIQKLLKKLGILQKQARSVMLLGASKTSYYLGRMLLDAGNSVKIIEQNKERCEEFSTLLPGAVIIHGDGAAQDLLLEEGIGSTDGFVALTGMDEENILVSFFAASCGVPKVISKVNRSELAATAEKLGLDCIVSPKNIISDVITRYARALQNTLGNKVETLYKIMDGKAEALEFHVQPDFDHIGIPLKKMQIKQNILIAGIIRGRKTIVPSGDDMILADDRVIVLAAGHRLDSLSDIMK